MSASKRKIYKYRLQAVEGADHINPAKIIKTAFERSLTLPVDEKRMYDSGGAHRVHYLEMYRGARIATGYFVSAKYNHRPDVVSHLTLQTRANPKRMDEGDGERTHFAIGYESSQAVILLDKKNSGLGIGGVCRYLTDRVDDSFSGRIQYEDILSAEFLVKLNEMSRVRAMEITIPTREMSETFGFDAMESGEMKGEVIVSTFALRGRDIVGEVKRFHGQYRKNAGNIKRIRVYGKMVGTGEVKIDTEMFKDTLFVDVELDDNGLIISDSILPRLKEHMGDLLRE